MVEEYKSDFDDLIRIKKKQKNWIRENKPAKIKTMAGFLDIIINDYKKNE